MIKDLNGFLPIKILFLGPTNCGKTSIIKRLTQRPDFKINKIHELTIGLDIYIKALFYEGQTIKCEFWDTAGTYGFMTEALSYLKKTQGVIFVFDISNIQSFEDICEYIKKYKEYCKQLNKKFYGLVIGNKTDKNLKRIISYKYVNKYIHNLNKINAKQKLYYFEISAKDVERGFDKSNYILEYLINKILIGEKIILNKNINEILRLRYILKQDNFVSSKIYKQIDIFVKSICKLFPLEDFILQIINDMNDFYKQNVYTKKNIENLWSLKSLIFDLEMLLSKLIDIFKIVAIKYSLQMEQSKKKIKSNTTKEMVKIESKENGDQFTITKSLLESNISQNDENLLNFIKSNELLRKEIKYVIHNYLMDFILKFNSEIVFLNKLEMIVKKDNNEELFIYKYFCDIEKKKNEINDLFNDNYVHYYTNYEMHEYYIFIHEINNVLNQLDKFIKTQKINFFISKGESSLNLLKPFYLAYNKEFDSVKDKNIKQMTTQQIEQNLFYYGHKSLKYYKYCMKVSDREFNKNIKINNINDILYRCINIRLYIAIIYITLDKKYEGNIYLYSAFILIKNYSKESENEKSDNDKKINYLKTLIELFCDIYKKLFPKTSNISNIFNNPEINIKKKLKYALYSEMNFCLYFNQREQDLDQIKNISESGDMNSNSTLYNVGSIINTKQTKYFHFFSFPNLVLKIYKTSEATMQFDDAQIIRTKLYELYADSVTFFRRKQYNMFLKVLSNPYNDKESLLKYDPKDISSLNIQPAEMESILSKYDFVPDDIAQLFNLIGITLLFLCARNNKDLNDEQQINLLKKYKNLALLIFNAGLNDDLINKANKLDENLKESLNLSHGENPYRTSLEQIRNCLRQNISLLFLVKSFSRTNEILLIIKQSLFDFNDYPINLPLQKRREYIEALYLEEKKITINNKDYDTIINKFANISNYLPYANIDKKDNNDKENLYLNYYLNINDEIIDEYDLFNTILNYNEKNNNLFITPQNFKEKFIYWSIKDTIKENFVNLNDLENIDENILKFYLEILYELNLYEEIILIIKNYILSNTIKTINKNSINTYYITLYKCYKKLNLYDKCKKVIKKILSIEDIQNLIEENEIDLIENIEQEDFNYIYKYYKNLENERHIIYIAPLMTEKDINLLKSKYNNDENIFNMDVHIIEDKIEENKILREKYDKEKELENKYKILCLEGNGIYTIIQILFLCELENYLKKPICQIFDLIVTSKEALFIGGLLLNSDENNQVRYHANDILKIIFQQKETLYNPNEFYSNLKNELYRKIFSSENELTGKLYYLDIIENNKAIFNVPNNKLIFDLLKKYNLNKNYKNDNYIISLNDILNIVPNNINKTKLYIVNIGGGNYSVTNNEIEQDFYKDFCFINILKDHFLNLNINLNTSIFSGKYSLEDTENKFNEILNIWIEYFNEQKTEGTLYNKFQKFFDKTYI